MGGLPLLSMFGGISKIFQQCGLDNSVLPIIIFAVMQVLLVSLFALMVAGPFSPLAFLMISLLQGQIQKMADAFFKIILDTACPIPKE